MNCAIPNWILILQALLTPTIAALAVLIGVFQWRTAQQKVVLDLFDRRFAKYTAIRDVVSNVITSGRATSDQIHQFSQAIDGVEFLSRSDVEEPLREIHKAIGLLTVLGPERKELGAGSELQAIVKKERETLTHVETLYATIHTRLKPYLCMHQKQVWF